MMNRRFALLLPVMLSLGASECRFDDEDDLGEEEPVVFETLLYTDGNPVRGTISGIVNAQLLVVRDVDAFAELWDDHAAGFSVPPVQPTVAFGDAMVIAAFLGQRATGGYSIQIEDIRENDAFIVVDVETTTPGDGCAVEQVVTQPHHMVVLDDSDKPVNFIQSTVEAEAC